MTQQTLAPKPVKQTDEPGETPPIGPASSDTTLRTEVVRVVVSLLVSAGVIALGGFGAKALVEKYKRAPAESAFEEELPKVRTQTVVTHDAGLKIHVDGVAVPFKEIQLAAEVAGRVDFKSDQCRAGNFVSKGTELIRIDRENYQLEFNRLEKEVEQAANNIAELAVEIANAEKLIAVADKDKRLRQMELTRQETLKNRGVGTDSAVEAAQRSFYQAENAFETVSNQKRLLEKRKSRLETSKNLAEIQLSKAQLDLDRTIIRAPIDGVIVTEMAEADSFVQRGTNLLTIEDTSKVEVRCSLTMDELYRLWQSDDQEKRGVYDVPNVKVTVIYELADQEFTWNGYLARYDGIGLDQRTRTVPCRIVVPKPQEVRSVRESGSEELATNGPPALVRGMFVKARLELDKQKYLRVPQTAVQPGPVLWLFRDGELRIADAVIVGTTESKDVLIDGQASRVRPVKLSNKQATSKEKSGDGDKAPVVVDGDEVVTSPMIHVVNGMKVEK